MGKGFTLIELSIVLVVVGLLIGGILIGRTLMNSASINAQVMQIGQFDAAVIGFKQKFRYLPADEGLGFCSSCSPTSARNGMIDTYNGLVGALNEEPGNFWNVLFPKIYAACPDAAYIGCRAVTSGSGKNVPLTKIGKKGSFLAVSALTADGSQANATWKQNYYSFLNASQAQTSAPYRFSVTNSGNAAVTTQDAYALDQKMDNGRANSGTVISGGIAFGGASGSGGAIVPLAWYQCTSPAGSSSSPTYNLSEGGFTCTPLVRLGGTVGSPL